MSETPTSYLGPGMDAPTMASFFEAAAALFRADPLAHLPHADEPPLFSVTVPTLGVRNRVMAVAGEHGQRLSLQLFTDMSQFDAYQDAAYAAHEGEDVAVPQHFTFTFGAPDSLPDGFEAEVAAHGWELASHDAYPLLIAVEADGAMRPPTLYELTFSEALARALVVALDDTLALQTAFGGGPPVTQTHSARTYDGFVEVTLRAPHPEAYVEYDPSRDLLADLASLAVAEGRIDPDARAPLEAELLRRFGGSPEARTLDEDALDACQMIMELAAERLGATVATLQAPALGKVLFELVPERVSIEPAEAGVIITTARALYTYLKRALALPQADACLALLDAGAVARLTAALDDPSLFSPAKAFVMDGRRAGFDMSSPDGIKAWLDASQRMQLAGLTGLGVSVGPAGQRSPAAQRSAAPAGPRTQASKNKRKAERKARKKKR